MATGTARRYLLRSRLLIGLSPIALAALGAAIVWSQDRHNWWTPALLGANLVVLIGSAVAAGLVASLRRRKPAGFVLIREGFAVRPVVPPELLVTALMSSLVMQVVMLIDAWRDFGDPESRPLAMEVAFASVVSILVVGVAAVTALVVSFAWQGYAVKLTPAGIWSRAPLHKRLIPWQALAVGGPARPRRNAYRLQLVVERPDLVVQRGWHAMFGTRRCPTLVVDTHPWFLAAAIRWYAEHPKDRAAIGTPGEYDRLVRDLTAAAHVPAEPEPVPPPPTTPTAEPAAMQPVPPRRVRAVTALVYITVAVALVTATTDLAMTIIFHEDLLAAERAIAASMRDVAPPDGGLSFSTDTVAFAKGSATVALIGTLLVAAVAIALARVMSRGSNRARVGLAILSAVTVSLAMCPCVLPAINLAAEPAAGPLLNIWPAVRILEGSTVAVLAAAVLVLLLNTEVVASSRRSP
jgi:hypothetical protein